MFEKYNDGINIIFGEDRFGIRRILAFIILAHLHACRLIDVRNPTNFSYGIAYQPDTIQMKMARATQTDNRKTNRVSLIRFG